MKVWIPLLVLLTLVSGLSAEPNHSVLNQLKQSSLAFNKVAEKANPAVVSISTVTTYKVRFYSPFYHYFGSEQFGDFGMPEQAYQKGGLGSGVIISNDGYILTNHHVIDDVDEITITLSDGREFAAKRIGSDAKTDIALLKINGENLPSIKIGNSDTISVGDWAVAIGNPFGLQNTLTVGVISALGRSDLGQNGFSDFIQTDAAINPGNSGGALLNINGELIGINTAIYSQSGGYMGIGFAIPVNTAMRIMSDLKKQGHVTQGWIGIRIQDISTDLKQQFNLKSKNGSLVTKVIQGSPADIAGVKRGDIITHVNGKRIQDSNSLISKVLSTSINDTLRLSVVRNQQKELITVKVIAYSDNQNSTKTDKLGITVEELTTELQRKYRIRSQHGLLITQVKPRSIAEKKGFKVGMVLIELNYTELSSINQYKKILRESNELLFLTSFRGYSKYIVIR